MATKYILILGEDGDISIDIVMCWINRLWEHSIVRINGSDDIKTVSILASNDDNSQFEIELSNGIIIKSQEIHSYWYRRGYLKYTQVRAKNNNEIKFLKLVNKYYLDEWEYISEYLFYLLDNVKIRTLNKFSDNNINRLIVHEIARKNGLHIPKTLISNDLQKITSFLKENPITITKTIRNPGKSEVFQNQILSFAQGTNLFSYNDLAAIDPCEFYQPTLFQEYINKQYEVRTFYIDTKFYSMAILSQDNEKTKVDFRNYDDEKPNRFIPIILPQNVEFSLQKTMMDLNINCGSIDLIYEGSEYFFLEINPVGQFDWVSKNCNYNIERAIAEYLVK